MAEIREKYERLDKEARIVFIERRKKYNIVTGDDTGYMGCWYSRLIKKMFQKASIANAPYPSLDDENAILDSLHARDGFVNIIIIESLRISRCNFYCLQAQREIESLS